MCKNKIITGKGNSVAEDLFVELFCDMFGPENSQYLSSIYLWIYMIVEYILEFIINEQKEKDVVSTKKLSLSY